MRKRTKNISQGDFVGTEPIISYYNTIKKTIQDYINEISRYNQYKSIISQTEDGTVMDDRSRLIDLYEAIDVQDSRIPGLKETLYSQLTDERYMMAVQDSKGKWIRDEEESKKVCGTQFEKIITGIIESSLFGYTLLEIMPDVNPDTGLLQEVNIIERRNVLPNQHKVVKRQHQWFPNWDLDSEQYKHNYVLINSGGLGMYASLVPMALAKKFTLANYVNFGHTYGQPLIQGKTQSESTNDRKKFAHDIANAATQKIIVTGLDDEIDVKTMAMSNSEKVYTGLISYADAEMSHLLLGSESMAGATQSYVGSTKAHEDIFRARIKKYRHFIENIMNEQVLPVLWYIGYIKNRKARFKYSNQIEMSIDSKIKLFDMLTDTYVVDSEEIEKEFGVHVGQQYNITANSGGSLEVDKEGRLTHVENDGESSSGSSSDDEGKMSDEEYEKRYHHSRYNKKKKKDEPNAKVNFIEEE